MKKEISKTGVGGTFSGYIEITMNYTRISKEVQNPYLHDEETKFIPVHKIEVYEIKPTTKNTMLGEMDSTKSVLWRSVEKIESEKAVENEIFILEDQFTKHLEFLANHVPVKTFEEKMAEKGYK